MKSKNDWYLVHKNTGEIMDVPDVNTANEVMKEQEEKFRREHQGPYKNFYQVNRKFFKMFEDLIRHNPSAALLFQFLLSEGAMRMFGIFPCDYFEKLEILKGKRLY